MIKDSKLFLFLDRFFNKEKVVNVLCAITAFLFLVVQSDSFFFNLGMKYRILEYGILGLWFLVLLLRLIVINKGFSFLKQFDFKFVVIPIALVFLSFIVNITNLTNAHRHVFIVFHLVLSPVVLFNFDLKKLFKYFLLIFLVFCVVSDFVWLIDRINSRALSFLPVVTNKAGLIYRFYGFGFVEVNNYAGFTYRNNGLFREPGVYGVFLVITLLMLFKKENRFSKLSYNIATISILVITSLLTFSTTTLIALFLIALLALFINAKFDQVLTYVKLLALGSFIFAFIYISVTQPPFVNSNPFFHALFSKMFNNTSTSFYNRIYDSVSSIVLILRNPITGNGWGVHDAISNEFAIAVGVYTSGGINSLFSIASVYGALFGYYVFKGWYLFNKDIFNKRMFLTIFSFVIMFIVLACEDMTNNFLFIFIPYLMVIKDLKARYVFTEEPKIEIGGDVCEQQ